MLRDGKEHTLHVVLGERPETTTASAETGSGESGSEGTTHAGMKVQDLRPDLAQRLGYEGDRGVLVVGVTPGGPADDAGIKPDDVIIGMNGQKVNSDVDFWGIITDMDIGDMIKLKILRNGDETEKEFKLVTK